MYPVHIPTYCVLRYLHDSPSVKKVNFIFAIYCKSLYGKPKGYEPIDVIVPYFEFHVIFIKNSFVFGEKII